MSRLFRRKLPKIYTEQDAWDFLMAKIRQADMFCGHSFITKQVKKFIGQDPDTILQSYRNSNNGLLPTSESELIHWLEQSFNPQQKQCENKSLDFEPRFVRKGVYGNGRRGYGNGRRGYGNGSNGRRKLNGN